MGHHRSLELAEADLLSVLLAQAVVENAGVYGILVLFGLIPPLMAWRQRYAFGGDSAEFAEEFAGAPPAVPGGAVALLGIGGTAGAIIALETWKRIAAAAIVASYVS